MVKVYYGLTARDSRAYARVLLAQAGFSEAQLRHDDRGAPYLVGGPSLSISHTAGAAAIALGESPVGVDVERHRPIRENLPKRVLSEPELSWYLGRGSREADFFALWTLKESYYKWKKTGLPGFPSDTEFYLEAGLWRLRGSDLRFSVVQKNGLSLTVCSQEQAEIIWVR